MSTSIKDESYVQRRKQQALKGSIRCPLDSIRHGDLTTDPRQLDLKNITRLVEIFKLEGCKRLDDENHVAALVSRTTLDTLIAQLGPNAQLEDVQGHPSRLNLREPLECLQGRHRIEAARRFLHPDDRWWVVDLYSDGKLVYDPPRDVLTIYKDLDPAIVERLREEYSNPKNFFDGDIYRHLRHAALAGDLPTKRRWQCKLSVSKRRNVRLLEERAAKHPQTGHLQNGLDELLPFPGLWPALHIGTFNRILSLRCPEEMTRYLSHILRVWTWITNGERSLWPFLDAETVTAIEGLSPKLAVEDHQIIQKKRPGLFRYFPESAREQAIQRVCDTTEIIPSLHTFLEDTKLLEHGAKVLKQLLPSPCRTSLYQDFCELHNGQRDWKIQQAANTFTTQTEQASEVAQDQAYRQLWVHAIRHFPEMICQPLRKGLHSKKPATPLSIELVWWHTLTRLAIDCGFVKIDQKYSKTEEIDEKMVEMFLDHMRPCQLWSYDKKEIDGPVIKSILSHLARRRALGMTSLVPSRDQCTMQCGSEIAFRCGTPFEEAFRQDQKALFLPCIDTAPPSGPFMQTFTVRQWFFYAFFGDLRVKIDSDQRTHEPDAPPSIPSPELAIVPRAPRILSQSSSLIESSANKRGPPSPSEYSDSFIAEEHDAFSSTKPPEPSSALALLSPSIPTPPVPAPERVSVFELANLVIRLRSSQSDHCKIIIQESPEGDTYVHQTFAYDDLEAMKGFMRQDLHYFAPANCGEDYWEAIQASRERGKRQKINPDIRLVNQNCLNSKDRIIFGFATRAKVEAQEKILGLVR